LKRKVARKPRWIAIALRFHASGLHPDSRLAIFEAGVFDLAGGRLEIPNNQTVRQAYDMTVANQTAIQHDAIGRNM
jgi:hypothetical protein